MKKIIANICIVIMLVLGLNILVFAEGSPDFTIEGVDGEGAVQKLLKVVKEGNDYTAFVTEWSSNEEDKATIDSNGVLHIKGSGDITITVKLKTADGESTCNKTFTIDNDYIESVKIKDLDIVDSKSEIKLIVDRLNADPVEETAGIVWEINKQDAGVAIIEDNKLKLTGDGVLELKATYEGLEVYRAFEVNGTNIKYIYSNLSYAVVTDETMPEIKILGKLGDTDPETLTIDSITSSDSDVIEVDGSELKCKKRGDAILTLKYKTLNFEITSRVAKTFKSISTNVTKLVYKNGEDAPVFKVIETINGLENDITTDVTISSSDANIVSIGTDNALVYHKHGKAILTISKDGYENLTVEVSSNYPFTMVTSPDTINITDATIEELKVYRDAINEENRIQINNSNLTIASNNTDVAEIGDGNTIKYKENGTAILTLTYDDSDDDMDPITKAVNVNVNRPLSLIVNPTSIEIKDDTTPTLKISLSSDWDTDIIGDAKLTLVSSDSNIVSIAADKSINYIKNGKANMTASYDSDGDGGEAPVTAVIPVSINKKSSGKISIDELSITVADDSNPQYTLTDTDGAIVKTNIEVVIAEGDKHIVNVDANKNLVYGDNGSANVTIKYKNEEFAVSVTVNKPTPTPNVSITVNSTNIAVTDSNTNPTLVISKVVNGVTTTIPNTDTKLNITTSNADIVGVSNNSLVYKKNGTATATVTYTDCAPVTVTVNVNKSITGNIRINTLSISVNNSTDNPQIQLTDTTNNQVITDINNITMVSSNTTVVSVNATNKTLVYNNDGTAKITLVYKGQTFIVNIVVNKNGTVTPYITHVRIIGDFDYSDERIDLDLKVYYSDKTSRYKSSDVHWTSDDRDIAKVDDDGEVRFSGDKGWVTIKARYENHIDKVTTKVTSSDIRNYKSEKDKNKEDNYVEEEHQALKVIKFSSTYNYNGFYNTTYNYETNQNKNANIKEINIIGDLDPSMSINALQLMVVYNDDTSRLANNSEVKYVSTNLSVAYIVDNKVVFTGASGDTTIAAQYANYIDKESIHVKYGQVGSNPYAYNTKGLSPYTKPENKNTNTVKKIQGLVINGRLDHSLVNNVFTVTVQYVNSDETDILGPEEVNWTSSNARVAKVLEGGIIQFTGKKGQVSITGEYKGKQTTLFYRVK